MHPQISYFRGRDCLFQFCCDFPPLQIKLTILANADLGAALYETIVVKFKRGSVNAETQTAYDEEKAG